MGASAEDIVQIPLRAEVRARDPACEHEGEFCPPPRGVRVYCALGVHGVIKIYIDKHEQMLLVRRG